MISLPPGLLLAAVAAAGAALSAVHSPWWVLPAATAAFLCGGRPGSARVAAPVLAVLLAAGCAAALLSPAWLARGSTFVAYLALGTLLPWWAGRFWRHYRELLRGGWERAARLEREQRLIAEQARLRERTRIAQDMHDALGHDLSLIALSAGALKLAPGLGAEHRAVAGDIRARAGDAAERLGEVVGLLREGPEGAEATEGGGPAPEHVPGLVHAARAAGLTVTLDVEGAAEDLPPRVVRAAFRVVQEGITNVTKHATGAAAAVRLVHDADRGETRVEVRNGPAPAGRGTAAAGGHGLIGLAERVRLAGGSLAHGPAADGGFAVTARLPHRAPAAPPPAPTAVAREHREARRRTGRSLLAVATLPLGGFVLLSAVLMAWSTVAASRAVLDAAVFDGLHLGQSRAEVAAVLPDHQTPHRVPDGPAPPGGRGTACEYYAITANPLADRAGDAYRLCWRDGRLVSRTALVH
ncbi:histidine kinase [Streptomyces sp. MP131-18]|uniref:sensor histidine kinase n=1 Tax=Streptomyces sp. MP131-18 TaxID=1857892 RepID=UPI0009D54890|nr:histidine kinase [Streptomyces sp. MP131-18]ONK12395.1 Sensor histidine kinase DesK [Streptomyces sp. MP131-18]